MIINMNGAKAPETSSPVLQEKTVTPETLPVVIGTDEGYDGLSQVTVNPDSQLKAENIRSGKTIFGVTGVFEGLGNTLVEEMQKLFEPTTADAPVQITSDMFIPGTRIDSGTLFYGRHVSNIDLRGFSSIEAEDSNHGPFSGIFTFAPGNDTLQGHIHMEFTSPYGGDYMFRGAWLYELPTITFDGVRKGRPGMFYDVKFHSDNAEILIPDEMNIENQMFYDAKVYDKATSNWAPLTLRFSSTYKGVIWGSSSIYNSSYPINIILETRTPPTVDSASTIPKSGINTITVPKGTLGTYQTASVWSTLASKMVEATE